MTIIEGFLLMVCKASIRARINAALGMFSRTRSDTGVKGRGPRKVKYFVNHDETSEFLSTKDPFRRKPV